MKKSILFLAFLCLSHFSFSQCTINDPGITQNGDVFVSTGAFQSVPFTGAGQYIYFYACAGGNYSFSTCTATTDTYITILEEDGTTVISTDADGCGTVQAEASYIAPATGYITVVVTESVVLPPSDCNVGITPFNLEITQTGGGACAPPGYDCDNAVSVTLDGTGNYTDINSTCLSGDNYDEGATFVCDGITSDFHIDGDDFVYSFVPDQTTCYNFDLINDDANMGFFVTEGCPDAGGTCISTTGSTAPESLVLTQGVTYYVTVASNPDAAVGGIQCGDYTLTIDKCPQGSICEDPIALFGSVSTSDMTCGFSNNYTTSVCAEDNYLGGEDIVYLYTVPTEACYTIEALGAAGADLGLFIFSDCPDMGGATCVASSVNTTDDVRRIDVTLAAGDYYIVIDTWPAPDCTTFTLDINECPPGNVCGDPIVLPTGTISQAGTTENFQNDYSSMPCGTPEYIEGDDVVYSYTVSTAGCHNITVTPGASDWPSFYLLDACPEDSGTCIAFAETTGTNPATTQTYLDAGTYYLIVSNDPTPQFYNFTLDIAACAQDGETCAEAIPAVDGTNAGLTTCGMGDNYDATDACADAGMNGEDVVLTYTIPADGCYDFGLANVGTAPLNLFILDGCPDVASNCLGQTTTTTTLNLTAGQNLTFVVASGGATCSTFDLVIASTTCPVGSSCALPLVVNFGSNAGLTTCGTGDDYENSDLNCGSPILFGEEIIMEFVAPSTGCFNFAANNITEANAETGIYITDACIEAADESCIGFAEANDGASPDVDVYLNQGETYYITVAAADIIVAGVFVQCTGFDLDITTGTSCPPGATCANPDPINSLPYTATGLTTCGFGDDFDSNSSCNSFYMNGDDYVFEYTPAADECVMVNVTGGSGGTGVFITAGCPDTGAACTAEATDLNGAPTIDNVALSGGTTYYITVSTTVAILDNGTQCTPFDISMSTVGCILGATCETPYILPSSGDFTEPNLTSCGFGDNYTSAQIATGCGTATDAYINGEDFVMSFTAPSSGCYIFDMLANANTDPDTDAGIFIVEGCPDGAYSCVGSSSQLDGTPAVVVNLVGGTEYFVIASGIEITGAGGTGTVTPSCIDFDLMVSQCPAEAPVQDCIGAVPVCEQTISYAEGFLGDGNVDNETPSGTCLANSERNSIWFLITPQTAGDLSFNITPNDLTNDYDFAVYDITDNGCEGIINGSSTELSCNYSISVGVTGATPTGTGTTADENAAPFNASIPVSVGSSYALLVSNFSTSTQGFTIDFGLSTAAVFDVTEPTIATISAPINCGDNSFTLDFSENVLCNTVEAGDFTIEFPDGTLHTVTAANSSVCAGGANFDQDFEIISADDFTQDGTYTLRIGNAQGGVSDACDNVQDDTFLTFDVDGVVLTIDATTDEECGMEGSVTASAMGGSGTYTFSIDTAPAMSNATGSFTDIPAGMYTVTVDDGAGCVDTEMVTIGDNSIVLTINATPNNPQCNGDTGSIDFTSPNGTPTYSYDYDGQATGSGTGTSITGLAAGTYNITVTDMNGCEGTASATIVEPTDVVLNCSTVQHETSPGANDGIGNVNISGGTGPYDFTYTDGGTNTGGLNNIPAGSANIPMLPPGTYIITVTDDNGCMETCNFTIDPANCTLMVVLDGSTNVSCNGDATGTADITVSMSNGTVNYSWDTAGITGEDPTNLPAGTHTLTVSDDTGAACEQTVSVTITEPAAVVLACTQDSPESIPGANDGVGNVNISGGTAPYDIAYTGPENGSMDDVAAGDNNITGLMPGTYNVTVTDDNGCMETCSFTISPAGCTLMVVLDGSTNVSCNGDATGTADITVSGDNGTVNYSWDTAGITGEDPTNLPAGTHTLTVSDDTGAACEQTVSVTITEPAAVVLACTQDSPESIPGANDGVGNVNISGGTAPYDIAYTGPENGSMDDVAAGDNNITGLIPGTYNVTVTDDNGCMETCSFTISPAGCTLMVVLDGSTNVSCNGDATGTADITVSMSNGTVNYSWDTAGITGEDPTNLPAGTHTLTVSDDTGAACEQTVSVTITEPAAVALACTQDSPESIPGANDGVGNVNISGGTAPYDIAYTGPENGSMDDVAAGDNNITGLMPGTYNVTVTDDNGCMETCSFTISPAGCTLMVVLDGSTNVSCNGDATGTASITVSGDNGTVNYSWDTAGITGEDPTNLPAGTHTLTVSDDTGAACEQTVSVTITEPAAVVLGCTQDSPESIPGANDGVGNVNISGGTAPYDIAYTGPENGSMDDVAAGDNNITGLMPGTYNVTVTDDNGCMETCSFTISPAGCTLMVVLDGSTNVSCNGDATGTADITVSGDNGTVNYSWDTAGITGEDPTNLPAGTHTLTVSDDTGAACEQTVSVTITEPAAVVLACTQDSPESIPGANDGVGNVNISGGTAPYDIAYTGPENGSMDDVAAGDNNITGLMPGTYNVTVTDDNGCMETCSFTISPAGCTLMVVLDGSTNVSCNGDATGTADITVSGDNGTVNYSWDTAGITGEDPTNLPAGTHTLTVSDDTGAACEQTVSVTITEPAAVVLGCTQDSPESIPGANDGVGNVNISGGTAPYDIAYTGPENGSMDDVAAGDNNITGLMPGTYNVTVTDDNGCMETCSFTIDAASCTLMAVLDNSSNVGCNGEATGTANITVSNTTGTVNYAWSTAGIMGEDPTNLPVGTHVLTVSDDTGAACEQTVSVTITEPAATVLNCSQVSPESIPAANDGVGNVNISGGTAPYDIAYTGPENGNIDDVAAGDNNITGLMPGTYNVTVTDDNGCMETCSFTISPAGCTLTATLGGSTNVICNGDETGTATINVSNTTGTAVFTWSASAPSAVGGNPTNLPAGTHSVTVTDDTGAACEQVVSVTITEPNAIALNCTEDTPQQNPSMDDGIGNVNIGGGTAPYTIVYTDEDANSTTINGAAAGDNLISSLAPGTYSVVVTDDAGCMETCSFAITPAACTLMAVLDASTNVLCNGDATGTANITVTNATGAITYSWSTAGIMGEDPTNLPEGTHILTVSDESGATCEQMVSVTITEPAAIALGCSQDSPESAVGANDGVGNVNISGGTAPYDIVYTGPENGNMDDVAVGDNNITGLMPGNYDVTITDDNGCTEMCSFTISPAGCTLMAALDATTNVLCAGDATGTATISVSGEANPVTYTWSASAMGATGANPTNLPAGNHSVTIADATGQACEQTLTVNITEPVTIALNCSQVSPETVPGAEDGVGNVNIGGGVGPFDCVYTDLNGSSTAVNGIDNGDNLITGLAPSTYTVVITDANGCTDECIIIIDPAGCTLSAQVDATTDVLCNGDATGSATISVSNTNGTVNYAWSVAGAMGNNPMNLPQGMHSVSITDDTGAACEVVLNVTINEPTAMTLNCTQDTPQSAIGVDDGVGNVNISDGTAPFTIVYTDADGNSNTINGALNGDNLISGLAPGTYMVTVTDANGCMEDCSFTISPAGCVLSATQTAQTNVTCNGFSDGSATIETMNEMGAVTYTWSASTGGAVGANPMTLPAGNHTVTVSDESDAACAQVVSVNITEPNVIVLVCAENSGETIPDANDGVGNVDIAGGTAPYVIDYTGASTGSINAATAGNYDLSALTPGMYDVTITDANMCTETCSFTITEAQCTLSAVLTSSTDVLCNGDATGTALITVSDNTGNTSFTWSAAGATGANPMNLPAGMHTVTISDDTGMACEQTVSVTINEPTDLELNCTQEMGETNPGDADGIANINITGGTADYTIVYTDSGANSTTINGAAAGDNMITALAPDTYTVEVTDTNGCTETCTVTISSANCALSAAVDNTTNVLCNGDATGTALISTMNADAGLTYTWSASTMGATGANPTNLPAGNHSVTVSDNTGMSCQIVLSVNITEPTALTLNCTLTNGESSPGAADGAIDVNISGATAPYIIDYTNNNGTSGMIDPATAGTNPIAGLPTGTYEMTVTDANGCTQTCTTVVPAGNCILGVDLEQTAEIMCFGDCTAAILVTPMNAAGTVTYDWSDDTLDGMSNPTGLCAGNYSLTITDDTGAACAIEILSFAITEPTAIDLVCAQTSPVSSTGMSDGEASVTINGGTALYDYTYDNPLDANPAVTVTGVAAGAQAITGLASGLYNVTITDANGCTEMCSFIIQDGSCVLEAMVVSQTNVLCNGGATGTAMIAVSNEAGVVDYDWSDDAFDGMSNPTTLPAGNYTVLVTDGTGPACGVLLNINILEPNALTMTCGESNPASTGAMDGMGEVNFNGGTAPYVIDYVGPVVGNINAVSEGNYILNGLSAGMYTATVTDANMCTTTCMFTITETGCDLVATLTTVDENCAGDCDGTAMVDVTAGTGPYSYDWSTGTPDDENATDLCAGMVTVTITAANGCELILTENVGTLNTTPTTNAGTDDMTCGQSIALGAIPSVGVGTWTFITGTGGTAVFDNPNDANTMVTIDVAGSYTFIWTENNGGCTDTDDVVMVFQDEPMATVTPNANTCNASADGSIVDLSALVTAGDMGGIWSDTDGTGVNLADVTMVDFNGITPGTYIFTYTTNSAAAGCVDQSYTTSILVEDCQCPSVATAPTTPLCNDAAMVDLTTMQITAEAGTWTIENTPAGSTATITGTNFDATASPAGDYVVRFTLNTPVAGCPDFSEQTINVSGAVNAGTANAPMSFCADATDVVSLFGELNGADAGGNWTETSGTPSTGGAFNPVNGTFDVSGQAAGNYTFVYTLNGTAPCGNDDATVTVSIFDEINAEAGMGSELSCSNTTVTLMGSSTTPGVTYTWTTMGGSFVDPANTNQPTVEVNGAGTFTLTVTSANGDCTATDIVVVTQSSDVPTADAGMDMSLTCDNNGMVTLDGSNSSMGANIELAWTDENDVFIANTPTIDVTTAGVYTLTVTLTTTTGTCDAISSVTVTDETANPNVVIVNGGLIDCITVSSTLDGSASDNGANFSYQWLDTNMTPIGGATNPVYVAMAEGTYTLQITNTATGCVGTASTEVLDASSFPVADAGEDMTLNCIVSEVIADGTNSQQGANFEYVWQNTDGQEVGMGQTLAVTTPGVYILSVTDPSNQCENSDAVEIFGDFDPANANAGDDAMISCLDNEAQLFATPEAGTYQWFGPDGTAIPGATSVVLDTEEIGIYTFTVTADDNGCTGSDTAEVLNNAEAPIGAVILTDTTTCFGDTDATAFIESVEGGENHMYSLDGQPFTSSELFSNLAAGTHDLIIQSDNGCEYTTQFDVAEGNDIIIDLGLDIEGTLGESFDLEATILPEFIVLDTMYWTGDSLSCYDCLTPTSTVMTTENYVFTVVDENGCTASDNISIFVARGDGIFVPNAFSPAQVDGFNDNFMFFTGEQVLSIQSFKVFDRWGEMMHVATDFEPNNAAAAWDGTYRGQLLNPQVLSYVIELTYLDGETRIITGDVTLF